MNTRINVRNTRTTPAGQNHNAGVAGDAGTKYGPTYLDAAGDAGRPERPSTRVMDQRREEQAPQTIEIRRSGKHTRNTRNTRRPSSSSTSQQPGTPRPALPVPCQQGTAADRAAWTSEDPLVQARAADRCRPCPPDTPCRTYAAHTREPAGVYGAIFPGRRGGTGRITTRAVAVTLAAFDHLATVAEVAAHLLARPPPATG